MQCVCMLICSDVSKEEASLVQQQQELQAKILSVLGGGNDQPSTTPAPSALQQLAGYGNVQSTAGLNELAASASSLLGGSTANGGAQAYNLNSPGVQQALDNLMSSSSNLLQNLGGGSQVTQVTNDNEQSALYQGYGSYPGY